MSKKPDEKPVTTAVTPTVATKSPMSQDQFKAVKRLTLDVTSISRLGEVLMQAQSEMYTIDMDDPANPGAKRPVPCVDILDCLRGEEYVLICSAVMRSTFARFNGSLQGQYFALRDAGMKIGKRYRMVEIVALQRVE